MSPPRPWLPLLVGFALVACGRDDESPSRVTPDGTTSSAAHDAQPPIGPIHDEGGTEHMAALRRQVSDGEPASAEAALATLADLDARGVGTAPVERAPVEALAFAALGDCRPAADLLTRNAPGLGERELAHVAARSAELAVASMEPPILLPYVAEEHDEELDAWDARLDAALCVLDQAALRFPRRAEDIGRWRAHLEQGRVVRSDLLDEAALLDLMWATMDCRYD